MTDTAAVEPEPRRLIQTGDHAHLSVGDAYPIAMVVKIQNGPLIKQVVQSVLVETCTPETNTPPLLVVVLAYNNFPVSGEHAKQYALYGTPDDVTDQLAHLMRLSHSGSCITWNDMAANVRHML